MRDYALPGIASNFNIVYYNNLITTNYTSKVAIPYKRLVFYRGLHHFLKWHHNLFSLDKQGGLNGSRQFLQNSAIYS